HDALAEFGKSASETGREPFSASEIALRVVAGDLARPVDHVRDDLAALIAAFGFARLGGARPVGNKMQFGGTDGANPRERLPGHFRAIKEGVDDGRGEHGLKPHESGAAAARARPLHIAFADERLELWSFSV